MRGMEEGRYIPRADLASLRKVFLQYSTVTRDGQPFLSYEDLIVRYLGLLPEGKYNRDTLSLYAGVVDQTKSLWPSRRTSATLTPCTRQRSNSLIGMGEALLVSLSLRES